MKPLNQRDRRIANLIRMEIADLKRRRKNIDFYIEQTAGDFSQGTWKKIGSDLDTEISDREASLRTLTGEP